MNKKVILWPGIVRSKNDGDLHFISAYRLARLYGVLPSDTVVVASSWIDLIRAGFTQQKIEREGWLELFPLYDGKYYNIHDDISCG